MRSLLSVPPAIGRDAIAAAADAGVMKLAHRHDSPSRDLKLDPETAEYYCSAAARAVPTVILADLWAALVRDVVVRDRKVPEVEPTPLCTMFGQGHQHFLERLSAVPREQQPPDRGAGRTAPLFSEN